MSIVLDCPFGPCTARIQLTIEQATPGDDETTVKRVPPHLTEPDSWFGFCPASLCHYPLTPREIEMLRGQERTHEHMAATREPSPRVGGEEAPPHSRAPKPTKDPYWFRPSTGDPTAERNGGQNVRPHPGAVGPRAAHRPEPLRYLPDTGPKGGNVASVAEVRAAIDSANESAAQAQEAARAAAGVLAEAQALVNWVRATSVDPLGGPQFTRASELFDQIHALIAQGIEANNAYKATL